MKKILFLSKSNDDFGFYRREFNLILNELLKNDNNIHIYDVKKSKLIDVNNNNKYYFGIIPSNFKISKNKFVIFINFIFFLLRNQRKYEIVQINYVREEYLVLSPLVKNLGKKLIILVYGSDFNKRTVIKNHFTSIYKYADKILFSNPILINKFINRHKDLKVNLKLERVTLPLSHFKYYEDFTIEGKDVVKTQLNLNPSKTIVSVGTCYLPNEQHELIIEQLQHLKNVEKYSLIFNLTGFNTDNTGRIEKLENLIKEKLSNFDYKILKGNLSDEEVANYRYASDIFINLRKMDQLVLSMLESNLAYTYVVTADWLPYQDYTSNTNTFVISDFSDLNNSIEQITHIPQEQKKFLLEKNKNYTENNFNEKQSIQYWNSIFNNH